ncbi:DUF3397 family protein [Planococcus ruber]|uniref:DUF3397 family protein n=1 Tax=Planococcus ruber TaxID=2027871 RepID=UPI001FED9A2E|nr:DUF3397 family protein [Planococcus ruber]MCJ1907154.1 DUF3397 domain-containing protein [Planococcus ruber]
MDILYTIGAVLIFAPFIAFLLVVLIARKKMKYQSIGLAADLTTFLLFFSVPVSIKAIWQIDITALVYLIAILIAIVLLVIEWRQTKEIEILRYIRQTWRMYFVLLALAYSSIWAVGIVLSLLHFFRI